RSEPRRSRDHRRRSRHPPQKRRQCHRSLAPGTRESLRDQRGGSRARASGRTMRDRRMARFLVAAFVASSVLHGAAYASLGFAPKRSSTKLGASSVVFEVHEAPPFETKPEPVKRLPPEEPKLLDRPS